MKSVTDAPSPFALILRRLARKRFRRQGCRLDRRVRRPSDAVAAAQQRRRGGAFCEASLRATARRLPRRRLDVFAMRRAECEAWARRRRARVCVEPASRAPLAPPHRRRRCALWCSAGVALHCRDAPRGAVQRLVRSSLRLSGTFFFSPASPKSHSHRHLRRRSPRFLSSTVSYTGHSLGGDAKGAAAAKAAARAAAKARRARNHKRARDAAGSGDGAQGASSVQRKREAAARALARRVEQAKSDAAGFICAIAAERRWVMSGTPTTGADDDLRTSVVSARLRTGLAQVRSYYFLLSVFFPTILTLVLLSFFFSFLAAALDALPATPAVRHSRRA